MNERRRPPRRGRGQRPQDRPAAETTGEPNPYRDEAIDSNGVDVPGPSTDAGDEQPARPRAVTTTVNTERQQPSEADAAPDNRQTSGSPRDPDEGAPRAGGDDAAESRREVP